MVCTQTDTPISPESEEDPFLHLSRFGILCKCSISSSLQQRSREWAGKDNSLGCSLLLLGAVKLLALVYQLQGKKYLWILFCSTMNLVWTNPGFIEIVIISCACWVKLVLTKLKTRLSHKRRGRTAACLWLSPNQSLHLNLLFNLLQGSSRCFSYSAILHWRHLKTCALP